MLSVFIFYFTSICLKKQFNNKKKIIKYKTCCSENKYQKKVYYFIIMYIFKKHIFCIEILRFDYNNLLAKYFKVKKIITLS